LLKAAQQVKSASAALWDAVSPDHPEFFIEFEGIPEGQKGFSNYEVRKIGFHQTFDFPLIYLFKGRQLGFVRNEALSEYNQTRNWVIYQAKKTYYLALKLQKQVQLFHEMIRLHRENYQKARIRVIAGEATPYDTLKVKVGLATVENQAIAVEKELKNALASLAVIMGRAKSQGLKVTGELIFQPMSWKEDSLLQLATRQHPKILKNLAILNRKKVKGHIAWTKLLPDISLRYFRMDYQSGQGPKGWGGELGLSVPLWFFLKSQGQIRTSHHQVQASRWQYNHEKQHVLLDIQKAMTKLQLYSQQVKNYQENTLIEAEELLRITQRSYEEGEMGYLALADALQIFNRTQVAYTDALYHYWIAFADLEYAVGGPLKLENKSEMQGGQE
jgi:cobalt-zinc-cadmium resistance protein CzcA